MNPPIYRRNPFIYRRIPTVTFRKSASKVNKSNLWGYSVFKNSNDVHIQCSSPIEWILDLKKTDSQMSVGTDCRLWCSLSQCYKTVGHSTLADGSLATAIDLLVVATLWRWYHETNRCSDNNSFPNFRGKPVGTCRLRRNKNCKKRPKEESYP